MLKEKRRKVLASGPYKGLYHGDALFQEVAKAIERGNPLSGDEFRNIFPEDERTPNSPFWRKKWEDWLFDRCPKGLRPYECGGGVRIPELSRDFAEKVREYIRLNGNGKAAFPKRALPEPVRLTDDEADEGQKYEDSEYTPHDGDERSLVERQIKVRRGQQQFRDAMRKRYGNRCMVTGCEVVAVLEATHINPYRGENDNNPTNGLLLRADIHTLFDLDLIGIKPDGLQIEISPKLAHDNQYGKIAGKTLDCKKYRPSPNALESRYKQFQQRNRTSR